MVISIDFIGIEINILPLKTLDNCHNDLQSYTFSEIVSLPNHQNSHLENENLLIVHLHIRQNIT